MLYIINYTKDREKFKSKSERSVYLAYSIIYKSSRVRVPASFLLYI